MRTQGGIEASPTKIASSTGETTMAKHATLPQIVEIGALLKLYCLLDESTGLAMYLSGWSDQAVEAAR
jgi:hypothetical protein